ncbi:related to ABC transporter protein (ATP-binding-cassette protein) [Phialocephala subalpina]|uniref:Related to ABC transporter protein (ATP-binding-cassette protein) n=1 Tax=Phialocephala subalpina TaxID=576137 RepID=A0A1L7X2W5_9HELO|nr:related to ABC transporter protein (ATP-binding-cassette protein) [Phialocephala subalpina]
MAAPNNATLGDGTQVCLMPGGVPVTIQNKTSWESVGCLEGFFCQHNTDDNLPQYCPPLPECQDLRLSGVQCTPQGTFEPVLCDAGWYCPNNGTQRIECPSGSYCPHGVASPIKCSIGSRCPAGSQRNMNFLPMGILLLVDIILITATVMEKLRSRYKKSNFHNKRVSSRKAVLATGAGRFRNRQYQEIDEGNNGFNDDVENEYQMEPAIRGPLRVKTGFEQLGAQEADFMLHEELANDAGGQKTDLHLFVQSLSKCLGATKFGLTFEFQDLGFKPPKSNKKILDQVSGTIHAGSLWGVMGASGAGKSTFVNVLMGKTSHTGGITKVNGVAGNISKYKKIIGYVPQDDIVLPEMTVRENILHSARIRLPANWSNSEIEHHVDILVSCLQLSHVKDSLVGSPGAPVISGGQRKRVSIGMELAAAPMAVFLDEPTSGLDATAAASIMSTLKALSRLGMTIVTIIHQPRQEIFESLDSLVLLGQGRMIYCGPERGIQPHFQGLGFDFPDHTNPADVMGDIIAGEGRHYKPKGDASVQYLIDHWQRKQQDGSASENYAKTATISMGETNALSATIKQRGAPWFKQIYFCFQRSLVQQYRMKSSFYFELGVGAMAGFLIGLAELNQKGQNFRGIFNSPYDLLSTSIDYSSIPQMALLVGLAIGLTASAPGVKIFGEEKLVYWREAAAGHNRFAYYIGKVISTIPRMVLANFHFTTMFMLLSTPRIPYLSAFVANLLYFYCIYGLASIISMVTRREDGPLLAVMMSLIVGVLNGMSPSLKKVRSWHIIWIWRASPGTWLAEAYFTQNITPLKYLYQIDVAKTSVGYLLNMFGDDLLMLLAIGTIYRIVAFLGLRFMWRNKQR